MLSVWCLVPGNYPTARRLRPLRSLLEDRTIAEKSIDLILSRYLKEIEVYYPSQSIEFFGWKFHWLAIFFVLSVAIGFGFRRVFNVEI